MPPPTQLAARRRECIVKAITKAPQTVRGLSMVLSISKPAVTRACDRLVALGWITRTTAPADRRSVVLTITKSGKDRR